MGPPSTSFSYVKRNLYSEMQRFEPFSYLLIPASDERVHLKQNLVIIKATTKKVYKVYTPVSQH
jgi:hypothetical protein